MRGNITRRSWRLKFDIDTISGARRIRYVTVKGTRRDAESELARLLHEANTGVAVDPSKILVRDYLRSWLEGMHGLTPGSRETYGVSIEKRIIPAIGHMQLQKLRPVHVKAMMDAIPAPGASRYAHRTLKAALQSAVDLELVSRNVASSTKPPVAETAEVDILAPPEIAAALEALRGDAIFPVVSLALATGMRRGELLALRWSDLDGSATKVERAVEETAAGVRFKAPKTKHGRRTISIPSNTVDMLRDHRRHQLEQRMALGLGKPGKDALVFCDAGEDRPTRGDRITSAWKRAMVSIGINVKFHAPAHTCIGADRRWNRRGDNKSPPWSLLPRVYSSRIRAYVRADRQRRGGGNRQAVRISPGANSVPIRGF